MRKLLALCLAAVLFAGCSGSAATTDKTSATTSDKKVELTLYAPFGVRREAIDDAIYAYETKHPNVRIRVKELQGQGQIMRADGGINDLVLEGGDLILTQDNQALNLYKAGKLRDLSNVRLTQINELAAPLVDELGKSDGKRFGIPVSLNPSMLMMNQQAFTTAGVKVPAIDWTVQDFAQTLTALKAAGAQYEVALQFTLDPLVRAFGGKMYDSAKQAWVFDTPEAKQGLAFVGQLTKDGVIKTGGEDRIAIRIGGGPGGAGGPALSVMPGQVNVMPGMTMWPYPKGPKGRSVPVSAQVGAVLTTSANPEVATDFLKEVVSNSAIQQALAKAGIRPVSNDAKALAAWAEAVGDKTAQAIEVSLQGAYVSSATPNLRDAINGLDPFFKGTATLDEVVPNLIAKLK